MARKLCRVFAIDSRALAAFRIAAGGLLLVDMWIRMGDLAAHYTESGVLPLAALREWLGESSWRWSLYTLRAADWWPALLLGLTAVVGALLVVGLATRVATIVAWILLVSLHNRMPVVINAGDTLLHVLLLWGMFLPLGARWSVDAAIRRRRSNIDPATRGSVCSPASAAILVQMALLYLASGIFKAGNSDWQSGLSLYYVMSFDAYARPAAGWLLQHDLLLKLLTWGTLVLELAGPLVAFSPWITGPIRLAVVASFVAFHLGIEATMTVGLFSWVSIAGWLLFLPARFWDSFSLVPRLCLAAQYSDAPRRDSLLEASQRSATQRAPEYCVTTQSVVTSAWRWCGSGLVFALLALTLYWNATGFRGADKKARPAWCRPVMQISGLRQEWRMFTRPPKHDGWPRIAATLADGSQWDLLEDVPGFDWQRRELPSALAPNHRWRKYYNNLADARYAKLRPYFCRFLARQFHARHTEEIHTVHYYQVQEITGPPGEPPRLTRKLLHQEAIRTQGAFLDAAEQEGSHWEIHPGI